eukprot:scaffold82_cov111-Cylindrotheca_fusiformis.AAC.1
MVALETNPPNIGVEPREQLLPLNQSRIVSSITKLCSWPTVYSYVQARQIESPEYCRILQKR